ncbi:hypothetical protein NL108_001297 [Boleophthalmus pectinirostris]|uniref:H-2 class II histocompatibility antigen, A-Q alpha chain-like n=1 Tax=Boleophthalmus pectinirostris TaxID=150288 RepID=UPI0024325221|nr:H-2 class II histocompatibility antigen, A-Q alpha chain-like [Boleophthalmus pectinirostris]KAJ0066055.1 hypothetical protein NL108_001297 [Boleophthalmus pectinirostris]
MKPSASVLCLFLNYFCAFSQYSHELRGSVGCYPNDTAQFTYDFDGDLVVYADFQNSKVVYTIPPFIPFDPSSLPDIYQNAWRSRKGCWDVQSLAKVARVPEMEAPEVKDPPESILYPAEEVLLKVENSLVCFVNRFYPPVLTVTWTKNNHPVSEGVSTSAYIANSDQTFHCFSTLTFIPEDGDMYSCTVEHPALEKPKTRTWDVDVKKHGDLALDLYCGVGLTVALLGVAIGTFLIVKGRYRQLAAEYIDLG